MAARLHHQRRSRSSSTGRRASPRREQRPAAMPNLRQLVMARRVMLTRNSSHRRSRVEESVLKRLVDRSLDTGLKDPRMLRMEQALRTVQLAQRVQTLVRETQKARLHDRVTRKKRKRTMMRRRILSTKIQWNLRRPRNSNPSGRSIGSVTGGEEVARHS